MLFKMKRPSRDKRPFLISRRFGGWIAKRKGDRRPVQWQHRRPRIIAWVARRAERDGVRVLEVRGARHAPKIGIVVYDPDLGWEPRPLLVDDTIDQS